MPDDLEKQFEKTLQSLTKISFEATQKGLLMAGEETVKIMSSATNTKGSGRFKASWKLKKYPNKVFVYNDRKGDRIPLTNIAEYSVRGPKPFIKQTEQTNQNQIKSFTIKKIENEIRRRNK